jgi:hypothetical protein
MNRSDFSEKSAGSPCQSDGVRGESVRHRMGRSHDKTMLPVERCRAAFLRMCRRRCEMKQPVRKGRDNSVCAP